MKQLEQLKAIDDEKLKAVYDMEAELVHTCFEIERVGVQIDREYCEKAVEFESHRIAKAEGLFKDHTGIELVDSGKCLGPIFQGLGFSPGTTETGEHEITDSFLAGVTHPLGEVIREYRDARKRANTYFRSYLYFADKNGVIHANMKQSGTKTGRVSYMEPNLQNIPSEGEDGGDSSPFPIRRAFVPKDGYFFLSVDFKAMELRMMLDEAGQHDLIEKIKAGLDPHDATAELTGLSRKQAKTLNFACIAEGQLVLTNTGLKPIETVEKEDLVWDGCDWVKHDGVIFQGYKEVLTYDGLTATPDHKVFTSKGRKICFGDAIKEQGDTQIFNSETAGLPNRYPYSELQIYGSKEEASDNKSALQSVREYIRYSYRGYPSRTDKKLPLPEKCEISTNENRKKFNEKILVSTHTLYLTKIQNMEKLWWAWNTTKNICGRICEFFYKELLRRGNSNPRCRSDRQYGSLRNRELEARNPLGKFEEPKIVPVYDIVNAGPRNRFTVSGKLVSNCLYGAGKQRIAEMIGVTAEEAGQFKRKYFAALPMVENFILQCTGAVNIRHQRDPGNGWIRTWFGRRGYFDDPKWAYKAANFKIQGGSADCVKIAMNRLHLLLKDKKSHMILQIHDELLFHLSFEEMDLISEIMQILETAYPHRFLPLTCSMGYSLKSFYDIIEKDPRVDLGKEARNSFQGQDKTPATTAP